MTDKERQYFKSANNKHNNHITNINSLNSNLNDNTNQSKELDNSIDNNNNNNSNDYLVIENKIIDVIFQRINLLLPYISGYSIQQVLAEPSYIQSKSHLLKLSNNKLYLSDLVSCIYNLLIKILENDNNNSNNNNLYDKSINTLNSIYILITLLSEFLNNLKLHENMENSVTNIFKKAGVKLNSFTLIDFHLTSKPRTALDDNLVKNLLRLLFSLKSEQDCVKTLYSITDYYNKVNLIPNYSNSNSSSLSSNSNSISNSSSNNNNNSNYSSLNTTPTLQSSNTFSFSHSVNPLLNNNSINSNNNSNNNNSNNNNSNNNNSNNNNNNNNNNNYISQLMIDDHLEVGNLLKQKLSLQNSGIIQLINNSVFSIFRYIAASNSTQYYEFQKFVFKNIPIERLFIKGSQVLQFTFLSSSNFNSYIQLIRDLIYYTKRTSQRYLFLHYFVKSILSWAISRTNDFLKVVDNPTCSKNAEVLFDILIRNLDSKYCPKVYYSILSGMILFQPKYLSKFIIEKSNKSTTQALKRSISNVTKLNSNKQKFLSDFIQLINKSPEFAQPLISFLLIGCSVSTINKNHPLFSFVIFLKDDLIKQLKLDNINSDLMLPLSLTTTNSSILSNDFNKSNSLSQFDNQNFKINQDLRIGVLAISIVVNPNNLSSQLLNLLNSPKISMSSFILFTGAFKLLAGMPSLTDLAFRIIQDLTPILLRILTISCDVLSNTSKRELFNDLINDNLNVQLSSINFFQISPSSNRTSSFSSSTGSFNNNYSINTNSSNNNNNNNNTGNNLNKLKSNNQQALSSSLNSSYKSSPLKLSYDDARLDSISMNSSESIRSYDSESKFPYFKVVDSIYELKENIHYSTLKNLILKSSNCLLKENIINLLMIYGAYPFLCFIDTENEKGFPDFIIFEKYFKNFIEKIVKLLYLNDDNIFEATESLLTSFCLTVSNIYPARVFLAYMSASILIDSVSVVGLSLSIDMKKRNEIIKLVFNLVHARSEHVDSKLLINYVNIAQSIHTSGTCGRIVKNFERLIYLGLFSSNIETIRISKRLLQFYLILTNSEIHLPTCYDNSNIELSKSILNDKMSFGLVTIKKKMRDRLCHLKKPTETLLSIWSLMYEKVAISYDYEHGPNINSTMEEIDSFFKQHHIVKEIEIYSEYLASLGGIILSKEFVNDLRQPLLKRSLEKFLGNKFISLFSKDPKKREHSREILSISIHPYLCETLLKFIKLVLPRFLNKLNKGEFNICELFLGVLRSICQIETNSLFPHATELWNINFTLLKMLNIENNSCEFLRLKLKFCKLQVLFLGKLKELSLNGNILQKNEYARIAADYLESSFSIEQKNKFPTQKKVLNFNYDNLKTNKKMSNKIKEFKESELKDLLMDIKVEVSVMLKMIFYKLPLDTPKKTSNSDDINNAENVVFSNYFNLFVRLLEKLHESKDNEDSYTPITHRVSNIIKEIIQALINLLNSNSSIGLKYSLPLGYHNDDLIRVSFVDVFSKIIKEIYSNYEKKVSLSKLYEQLIEIFTSDFDLFLSSAASCPKSEIEAYSTAVFQLPIDSKQKLKLLLSLIRIDVLQTSDKNEILRSNTVGTRVTALYSRERATNYLKSTFKPIFQQMLDNEDFFEIEKVINKSDEEKEKNLHLFFKYLNLIADAIFESINYMPIGIRLISKTIFDSTMEVMPEIKFTSLNAYLFLRLINPTIVSPEHADIVASSNPLFKRSLIQLARVIQTMVNESPIRIPLLEKRSDDLLYSKKKFFSFMKDVVTFNIEQAYNNITFDEEFESVGKIDDQDSQIYLHGFLYDNWMEIRDIYSNESFGYETSRDKKFNTIKKIDNILLSCGLPKRFKLYEIPDQIKNDKTAKGILLYDFLSKTSLALEYTPFIKVLITKDGLPLICINTLEFTEGLTGETYIYNVLQTLVNFWDEPYCFLIDLTAFKNFSIIVQGIEILNSISSPQYKETCKRIYCVNMSPSFVPVFKDLEKKFYDSITTQPDFIFISSNDDEKVLSDYKLVGYKNPTFNDGRVTFHDVSIYQEEIKRFIPIKLKIGYNFIQIYTALPLRIKLNNKMCIINLVDCYKINELDDVALTAFTGIANEISMTDMKTNKKIILTSPKKIEIMRTIYFSRAVLNNNNYTEDEYEVKSNPTFIVGQLLNISFAGLLSKSADIRKASYALLSSIQQSVGLQTGKYIDDVDGVVFPYGNIDYVSSVSFNIAQNHPTLTYVFILGFLNAYDALGEEDKNSLVLCASPWIKNIYRYVYLSNSILGPGRTCDIVRKFVRASRAQKHFQVFSLFIWPQLSLEDGLIDIIIDEIVAASIDHEAEGNDWQRITKYWPLRSSIEICSVIIKRMKDESYNMPLDETDIEAHTRWVETTVLARFLSYLIFDSLLFVERYISDIFYIVTIYMDHGPLELRNCLINLLGRTFHSYLSKPSLTIEQHDIIKNKIELLNGARFRMLFGLTRDDTEITGRKLLGTDILSKANSITTLCDLLTSFLKDFFEPEEYELQIIKWNSCVCKIAFDYNAQLQSRAILVMGSLTKQGISKLLVLRFINLLRNNTIKFINLDKVDSNSLKLTICALHAFGKLIIGINKNSIFHPLNFWFNINLLMLNDISFFRYGIDFLKATLINIDEHTKSEEGKQETIVDYLFKFKPLLNDLFDEAENKFKFKLTKENFDVVLSLIICKGLKSPFTYNYTIETIKTLLKIRYNEFLRNPLDKDNDFNCYLFFIFLTSINDEEMIKILEECGLKDVEFILSVNEYKIPKILIEWVERLTLNVYSICFSATNHFMRQKLDELTSTRVITLYIELFNKNPEIILKLYKQIDGVLQKFIKISTTPNLLETVLDMIVLIMNESEFQTKQISEEEWDKKLIQNNVKGISNFSIHLNNSICDNFSDINNEDDKERQEDKLKVEYSDKVMGRIIKLYKEEQL